MSKETVRIRRGKVGYRIRKHLPKEVWRKIKGEGYCQYLDREDLEGVMGVYTSEPGWRYDPKAVEVLADEGYEVRFGDVVVTTAEELSEALEEAKREAEETAKRRRKESKKARKRAARAKRISAERFKHNKRCLTDGLVRVGGHYDEEVGENFRFICKQRTYYEDRGSVKVLHSGPRCGLYVGTSTVTGGRVVKTTPGTMSVLYADEKTAAVSHRRHWESGGLDMAIRIVKEHLKDGGPGKSYGKEFRSWIWEEHKDWLHERIDGSVLVSTESGDMRFEQSSAELVASRFGGRLLTLRRFKEADEEIKNLGLIYTDEDGVLYAAVPTKRMRINALKDHPEWLPSLDRIRDELGRSYGSVFRVEDLLESKSRWEREVK